MKKLLLGAAVVMTILMLTAKKEAPQTPLEEPPLQLAPLPDIEPVEPKQELELEEPMEPKLLPPGVKCLDDYPLIGTDETERIVREYFEEVPILAEIAFCESRFRHYTKNGVLRNKQGSSATGVMQIMASYHEEAARNLGWSIYELDGNLAYAKWLYDREGLRPWEASRNCWGTALVALNNDISDT